MYIFQRLLFEGFFEAARFPVFLVCVVGFLEAVFFVLAADFLDADETLEVADLLRVTDRDETVDPDLLSSDARLTTGLPERSANEFAYRMASDTHQP